MDLTAVYVDRYSVNTAWKHITVWLDLSHQRIKKLNISNKNWDKICKSDQGLIDLTSARHVWIHADDSSFTSNKLRSNRSC